MNPVIDYVRHNGIEAATRIFGQPSKVSGGRHYWTSPLRADRNPGFEIRADGKCFDGGTAMGDIIDVWAARNGKDNAWALADLEMQLGLKKETPSLPASIEGENTNSQTPHPMVAKTFNKNEWALQNYGISWSLFQDYGCREIDFNFRGDYGQQPAIQYPLTTLKGGIPGTGGKVRSIARLDVSIDEATGEDKTKRLVRHLPGGAGWFPAMPAKGSTVVVTAGEEKALAARWAGYEAISWSAGEGLGGKAYEHLAEMEYDVILALDGDAAGRKATQAAAAKLAALGITPRVVPLPDSMDLNDYLLANGLDALRNLIASAEVVDIATPEPAEEEWPEPLDIQGAMLREFPLDIFDRAPWARAVVEASAEQVETNTCPAVVWLLGLLGAAVTGRMVVMADGGTHRSWANLYTMVVGAPGSGKTPILNPLRAPLDDYEQYLIDNSKAEVREGRARERVLQKQKLKLEKKAEKHDTPPEELNDLLKRIARIEEQIEELVVDPPRLTANDFTEQALNRILLQKRSRECCTAINDEGGKLLDVLHGLHSGGQASLGLIMNAFDGTPYAVDRVGTGSTRLRRPLLSIIAGIQPKALQKHSNGASADRGFLQRFLYAQCLLRPRSRRWDADERRAAFAEYADTYRALIHTLHEKGVGESSPVELRLSAEADATHRQFNRDVRLNTALKTGLFAENDTLQEIASKLSGLVLRLAGVLHVAENPRDWFNKPEIGERVIKNAIRVAMVGIDHADRSLIVSGLDDGRGSAWMVVWRKLTDKSTDGKMTRTELQNALSRPQRKLLDDGLKRLQEWNWIHRDGTNIMINPRALERWNDDPETAPPPSLERWLPNVE